jgi:hypothetical protein
MLGYKLLGLEHRRGVIDIDPRGVVLEGCNWFAILDKLST